MDETNQPTNSAGRMKFPFTSIAALVAVVLIALGVVYFKDKQQTTSATQSQKTETSPVVAGADTGKTDSSNSNEIKVDGGNFYFKPNEIRVKKGQPVKLVFHNVEGFHDFVVDELNVRTKQIKGDATETVEFTPEKTGTFEFYCSVGKHREMGMKGNIIVEE